MAGPLMFSCRNKVARMLLGTRSLRMIRNPEPVDDSCALSCVEMPREIIKSTISGGNYKHQQAGVTK